MGKKVKIVDLSHLVGPDMPLWPGSPDIKIERWAYHAKDTVQTKIYTTHMHIGTHADSPIHVLAKTPYTHELPLENYYGTGVVVDIPKKKWEVITPEDLENAGLRLKKVTLSLSTPAGIGIGEITMITSLTLPGYTRRRPSGSLKKV